MLKRIRNWVLVVVVIAALVYVGLHTTGNMHLCRAVLLTYLSGQRGPTIDDWRSFPADTLPIAIPQPWPVSRLKDQIIPDPAAMRRLASFDPVAFAVFHCDSLIYEQYWDGYEDGQPSNSFSMAKSIVALAVGVCLDRGLIGSLDEKVDDYIPYFNGQGLTIRHLLQMRSNINFDERYGDPLGFVAKSYYGSDQVQLFDDYSVVGEPGTRWEYLSGNTLLLVMIVEAASGKSIASFTAQEIWQHVGPENETYWSKDSKGLAKGFCCFISTARDFARIGKLVMNRGHWDGHRVVSEQFVNEMLAPVGTPDSKGRPILHYGMQWWLGKYSGRDLFYMRGMLGQYVICVPEEDLIIVRLGHRRSKLKVDNIPVDMIAALEAGFSILYQLP